MRACFLAAAAAVALPMLPAAPAAAQDIGKCKFTLVAKLPVVMEGDRASVPVLINGRQTRMWLDSGAFFNTMPKAKAVEFGLKTEPLPLGFYVKGIGGGFTPELATVKDFGIVGATLHNMQFVVGGSDPGNGFLGANLLGVLDTEFDLSRGAVNLFKETGCGRIGLAYWGKDMSVGEARVLNPERPEDHHIYVEVLINDRPIRAMLDSGAPLTVLGKRAAQRAGIDLGAPTAVRSMMIGGFGGQRRQSWIVKGQTISIGGETIRNSPIRVIDDEGEDLGREMLLGVDFLMSHHVLVSRSQRKMYLTYNGGPIFSSTTDGEIGRFVTKAENMGAAEAAAAPKTADEFAGRASARLNKGEVPAAIADFSEGIRLAPGRADFLGDRAGAYLRLRDLPNARRDIDAALALTPGDHRLLTRQAQLRLVAGDTAGALAATNAAAAALPRGSLDVMAVVSLYERLGRADRGLALIDPVINLHRDDSKLGSLLNARSWNRALANADLDRALADINQAIRRAGPLPGLLDTRALVQLRRKDYAAAIADETTALAKAPRMAAALFIRGLARIASGDARQGEEDIVAARRLRPAIDRFYAPYGLVAAGAKADAPDSFDEG